LGPGHVAQVLITGCLNDYNKLGANDLSCVGVLLNPTHSLSQVNQLHAVKKLTSQIIEKEN